MEVEVEPENVAPTQSMTEKEEEENMAIQRHDEELTKATDLLIGSTDQNFKAIGLCLSSFTEYFKKLVVDQSDVKRRVQKVEEKLTKHEGKLKSCEESVKVVEKRVVQCETGLGKWEREVASLQSELNDSFIIIAGIPEKVEGGRENTKQLAKEILTDCGFNDLAEKLIAAWRIGNKHKQPNQSAMIAVKFDTMLARRNIMEKVKTLPISDKYPKRAFYPKKTSLELKCNYRMGVAYRALLEGGKKVTKIKGGLTFEGATRVYRPSEFLPDSVDLNGEILDLNKLIKPRTAGPNTTQHKPKLGKNTQKTGHENLPNAPPTTANTEKTPKIPNVPTEPPKNVSPPPTPPSTSSEKTPNAPEVPNIPDQTSSSEKVNERNRAPLAMTGESDEDLSSAMALFD
jgi:hypothetical protein